MLVVLVLIAAAIALPVTWLSIHLRYLRRARAWHVENTSARRS